MRLEKESKEIIALAKSKGTIAELLNAFAVGTEHINITIPRVADPSELIPL